MALFVKTITGFICSCGKRFDGDDSGARFLSHIASNPTHTLEDYIYTTVPSNTVFLIVVGVLAAVFFVSLIKVGLGGSENYNSLMRLKRRVSSLEKTVKDMDSRIAEDDGQDDDKLTDEA